VAPGTASPRFLSSTERDATPPAEPPQRESDDGGQRARRDPPTGSPVPPAGVTGRGAAGVHVAEAGYGSSPFVSCASSGLKSDACIQWMGPEPMLFARIALAEGTYR
jgi:hypothetical protein